MSEPTPGLTFISRQLKQVLTDVGALKDDVGVLSAMVVRLDGTQTALLTELRAMHSQHGRLANRVRDLETRASGDES